mmetsp:Transcript_9697/g.11051  ORF Transcript_9697/g.11051 Transcript_9697/m.11051 type:complete len:216 (+) Transcript_9697:139-786(+)|eukprot:CAMPEP_0184021268 /NCGR_PEP_ID=MMETSP0954-20121128/9826_1 /TAXON_ID=627963 /ORGANISM="Aplanochytrium sp, Strain PBS07" /LENGTH=215 /DNA_ID=CAMNT_0026303253 /DNA_START=56 /DNA_END=703 /DNA_ORIENTATION=+
MARVSSELRTLLVKQRLADGSRASRRFRNAGDIPGVLYGKPFERHVLLTTPRSSIEKEIRERQGSFENTLYNLSFEDAADEKLSNLLVVPRTLQQHRYKNHPISCNFLAYDPEKGMKIRIPLFWLDEEKSNGLKRGGVLNRVFWDIKCHVTGLNIPPSLGVSLAGRNIGSRIRWSDIKVPDGVSLIKPPNNVEDNPVIATIKGKRSLMEADDIEE